MYKKYFIGLLFILISVANAQAAVIDVVDLGNGFFQVLSDGRPYGGGNQMSKAGLDRILNILRNQGHTINSTPIPNTAAGAGFGGAGTGAGGTGSGAANANSKALVPQQKTTTAVAKYDPKLAASSSNAAKPTTTAVVNEPNTALATTGKTSTPKPNASSTPKSTGVGAVGTGLAILGGVVGAVDMADLEKSKDRKTTWADVGRGAGDGAAMAAGTAAIINVVPGAQIGYPIAIAIGAVGGAILTGRKAFSETDCEYDPVVGVYSCCHISRALSNIQGRNVDIGGEMFCGDVPYVTKCVQGRKEHETDQGFRGLFMNDHWSKNCYQKWCPGYMQPEPDESGASYMVNFIGRHNEDGSACWYWECPEGMTRNGSKCVSNKPDAPETPDDEVVVVPGGKFCNTDADCVGDKLPQYAIAGRCIQKNKNERVCAATECKPGTYLVKKDGRSMGWCRAGKEPSEEQTPILPETPVQEPEPPVSPIINLPNPRTCTDPENMDANCNCIVEDTYEDAGKCRCRDTNKEIKNGKCEYRAEYVAQLESDINNAYNTVKADIDGLGLSVWRDADGNFNAARLASDSIAGVVLGTVGGVVTAKVVKKTQIKKGFEDIKCSIGGQTLADYGDDFVVGRN